MNFEKELKNALQEYETSLVEHYTELHAPERRRVMKGWNRWKIATAGLAAALVLVVGWQFITNMGMGSPKDAYQAPVMEAAHSSEEYKGEAPAEETLDKSMETEGVAQGRDAGSLPMANPEEKIIRYFNVSLETKNLLESVEKLEARIKELGGYIESSNRSGKRREGSFASAYYSLRIPRAKEEEARLAFEELGEIIDIGQDSENVTRYYRDTEGRVSFLKAKEEKLMEFLNKAENLEDILTIENKIMDLQFEREQLTGTLKDLDNRVDYDTYQITLRQVTAFTEVSFGRKVKESFILSLEKFQGFAENLVFFVVESWIFLLILALILFFGVRIFKKKKGRLPQKSEKQDE